MEQFKSEKAPSLEAMQNKMSIGLTKLVELAQLEARGENVSEEMAALTTELLTLVTPAVLEQAKSEGVKNEFGDMDADRFTKPGSWH